MADIEFHPVNENDFKKGLLSGEVRPHDVEINVKYRNGKTVSGTVSWETIVALYGMHNANVVGEVYESLIDNSL